MTDATHPYDALMNITARPPIVFVRGEGSFLWDDAGNRYTSELRFVAVDQTAAPQARADQTDAAEARA